MFKQITNLQNFNIFLGEENDLLTRNKENGHFQEESIVEYITETEINETIVETIINKSFSYIDAKNIYIITDSKQKFLEIWIQNLVSFLK